MARVQAVLFGCAVWGTLACNQTRPPGSQVHRELAGVDDVERSAAGAPADHGSGSSSAHFRLTGVVKAGGQRSAMLEDESGQGLIVKRGDRLGDFRVDAVGDDHIELSRPVPGRGRERVRLTIE
jgi:hypothetical protein